MKKLDIYIIKKFLGTFIFTILLILSIVVIFDVNEKLDKFLNKDVTLYEIIFDYYKNFIPYYASVFSSLFTFISVIFFTSKMANNSEIIAILASGVSFRRFVRPYMISAFIIAICMFALNGYIIPPANVTRIDFQNKYIKNKKVEYARNIQIEATPGSIAYFGQYDNSSKMGYNFSLDHFEGKELKSKLTAQRVKYDSLQKWTVQNYLLREFDGMHEHITKGEKMDTLLGIDPSDFLISKGDQEQMTTPQLKEYIDKQKKRGIANITEFEIEYERRYASFMASFILTIIGVSLSSRKIKGGMGLNIGIGLALSFSYILFQTMSSSFAISGTMSPRLSAWLPNIVYTIIAIYLYRKAPK
ncbi:MAG: LptF/LptG family permease [Candidatus Azobacteroides sp.]|nr:LptF/LptG family permease [Candidatus Azobacteroides sp.]